MYLQSAALWVYAQSRPLSSGSPLKGLIYMFSKCWLPILLECRSQEERQKRVLLVAPIRIAVLHRQSVLLVLGDIGCGCRCSLGWIAGLILPVLDLYSWAVQPVWVCKVAMSQSQLYYFLFMFYDFWIWFENSSVMLDGYSIKYLSSTLAKFTVSVMSCMSFLKCFLELGSQYG